MKKNMELNLKDYQELLIRKLSERAVLSSQLENRQVEIDANKTYLQNLIKARWTLAEVVKLTQRKVSSQIESLVTMAIQSVYDDGFKFKVSFDIKRNKSECILGVQKGDEEPFIPRDEDGGGLLDVVSFALRIVLWSLQEKKTQAFFWLDEPWRCLGDLAPKAGEMMKRLSKELDIQFVIITHDQRLMEIADRSFTVKHNGQYSEVRQEGVEEKRVIRRRTSK